MHLPQFSPKHLNRRSSAFLQNLQHFVNGECWGDALRLIERRAFPSHLQGP